MKPTIGRIVHYKPAAGDPRPAIVLATHITDDTLTLRVLGAFGDSTEFRVPFANTYKPGHWSWPPREEGQSA